MYDYEASYFCENVFFGNNTFGVFNTAIADSELNCLSLKDFNISRYKKYNFDYYRVLISNDLNLNGYKIDIWSGDSDSNAMICKIGTENLTKDFYYCGTAILTKSFYNKYGDLMYDDVIYEKMIFDRSFNYIKTECFNDGFLNNKTAEII
jgi:hypothetical protein